jgi:hypothetical protein
MGEMVPYRDGYLMVIPLALEEDLMPKRTPSGKKTKIASFEEKVKASSLPGGEREKYAIANKVGLMRGSKPTARGRKAARKG